MDQPQEVIHAQNDVAASRVVGGGPGGRIDAQGCGGRVLLVLHRRLGRVLVRAPQVVPLAAASHCVSRDVSPAPGVGNPWRS